MKQGKEIEDVQTFGHLLNEWHTHAVAVVEQFRAMPAGERMKIQPEGEPEEVLLMDGDLLKGFKLGLTFALGQLGKLPFGQAEPENTQPDEQPSSNPAEISKKTIH